MNAEQFATISASLPRQPGVYKYFDKQGKLIYVGKAKNIFKRVGSYFNKSQTTAKTQELVRHIEQIEFTVVNSEQDAFFLENSLIKEHQPKYNINLKDDKTYPYIVIKNEPFPRVFLTRRKIADGSEYLGPFTSVGYVRELLDFIRQNIPLRNCTLNLSTKNISAGKFKVCLEYHLGNCMGPCAGLQDAPDYAQSLQQIKDILRGNTGSVINAFKAEMKNQAASMNFEKAEILKKKIEHLRQFKARSTVVNVKLREADVFNIAIEDEVAFINYMAIQNGAIIQTKTIEALRKLDEGVEEILVLAIARLRNSFKSSNNEIVVPVNIDYPEKGVQVTVPRGGDKKKLLELSLKNAGIALEDWKRSRLLLLGEAGRRQELESMELLQQDLQLATAPLHIECFDNSHFQGSYYVSAMVCFRNGQPSKSEYRKYNIKTVEGIDDFAAMKEAVFRRYRRLKDESKLLPQLVIIDGGKGQLNAALEAVEELGLIGKMTLVAIAKNEEEVFFAGDSQARRLNWKGTSLNLVRRIRDEVHRFVIGFHRKQRSRGTFVNELETIPGIGKTTAQKLLTHFRSVKRIKEAKKSEIEEAFGTKIASLIEQGLHKKGLDGNPAPV